jgi:hypothetical protein
MLAANAIGVVVYLWGASYAWAIPEERAAGIDSVAGEPFVWAAAVFPVWAVFLALNGAWVGVAVARRQRGTLIPLLLVSAVWLVAVVVDYAHH